LQLVAGGNILPVRANAVSSVRKTGSSRVLSAWLQNALLFGETSVEFAARTGGPGANRRPKPVFVARYQPCGLGYA
jgi:hypothetical protein